jgi:hypothetical protein
MRLSLRVDIDGMYWRGGACMEIPEMFRQCFEPMRSGDVPIFSQLAGEVSSEEVRMVMKTREDAADILAKELAKMIVSEMKKKDTHNGYANQSQAYQV